MIKFIISGALFIIGILCLNFINGCNIRKSDFLPAIIVPAIPISLAIVVLII